MARPMSFEVWALVASLYTAQSPPAVSAGFDCERGSRPTLAERPCLAVRSNENGGRGPRFDLMQSSCLLTTRLRFLYPDE